MKPNWTILAWVVIAVLATLFITSKTNKTPETYKAELKGKDIELAHEKEKIKQLEQDKASLISDGEHKDSLLKEKTHTIEYRIKTIKSVVNAMPDDEINRAIERRFGNAQ